MKNSKLYISLCLIFVLLLQAPVMNLQAASKDYERPENGQVIVNGSSESQIHMVNFEYDYDRFLSLRDLALALSGTEKQFDVAVEKDSISITTGVPYGARGGEGSLWNEEQLSTWYTNNLSLTSMKIDGKGVKYFTFMFNMGTYYDAFISPLDASMLFNLSMEYDGENWVIDTTKDFHVDLFDVDETDYFQNIHGLYVGDATLGETYFAYDPKGEYAMASTTKLMTCLLTYEAIQSGQISMADEVVFSDYVDAVAHGTDKVLPLYKGKSATVKDLLAGALLPSSNEAAAALAEHVDGSEEAFVEHMNRKARELGMLHTYYYNCHGLPFFTEGLMPVKMQNHTSAEDLFILSSYIVNVYPEMLSITQSGSIGLTSLGITVTNTNYTLYNVKEMLGLKTGTTNKAGYCLVTVSKVTMDDGDHMIVTCLLGADSAYERTRISELAARYGIDRCKNPTNYTPYMQGETSVPEIGAPPKNAGELTAYLKKNIELK